VRHLGQVALHGIALEAMPQDLKPALPGVSGRFCLRLSRASGRIEAAAWPGAFCELVGVAPSEAPGSR